jgi:hypothetical protein
MLTYASKQQVQEVETGACASSEGGEAGRESGAGGGGKRGVSRHGGASKSQCNSQVTDTSEVCVGASESKGVSRSLGGGGRVSDERRRVDGGGMSHGIAESSKLHSRGVSSSSRVVSGISSSSRGVSSSNRGVLGVSSSSRGVSSSSRGVSKSSRGMSVSGGASEATVEADAAASKAGGEGHALRGGRGATNRGAVVVNKVVNKGAAATHKATVSDRDRAAEARAEAGGGCHALGEKEDWGEGRRGGAGEVEGGVSRSGGATGKIDELILSLLGHVSSIEVFGCINKLKNICKNSGIYISKCIDMHTYILNIYLYIHILILVHIYAHTHEFLGTYIYTSTHGYTYTHARAHTHTFSYTCVCVCVCVCVYP